MSEVGMGPIGHRFIEPSANFRERLPMPCRARRCREERDMSPVDRTRETTTIARRLSSLIG
jgi:hypothetical protein